MSKEIFPASFVSTESADGAPLRIGRGDESIRRATREEAERAQHSSQHAEAVEKLKAAYVQALQRADLETLFATPDALSGVFLPCPAETYYASKRRVLVVGQETRGWRNKSCSLRATSQVNDAEVAASMQATWEFASHGARRSKFMQFYRQVSAQVSPGTRDAVVWSNQFCVSFESGSPVRLPHAIFHVVKELSYDLLRAQLDILQPQVVIFTTGPARDRYLKECFPHYQTVKVFEPRRLWHFKIGEIHCLRTSHPRWARGTEHLDRAIQLALDPSLSCADGEKA